MNSKGIESPEVDKSDATKVDSMKSVSNDHKNRAQKVMNVTLEESSSDKDKHVNESVQLVVNNTATFKDESALDTTVGSSGHHLMSQPITHPFTETGGKKQNPTILQLKNIITGKRMKDTLHHMSITNTHCTATRCECSLMRPYGGEVPPARHYGVPRPKEEVKVEAEDFMQQYYRYLKQYDSPDHKQRLAQVMKEIDDCGTYELTFDELDFGSHTAWRNASRCNGRIQWKNLKVFDARDVTSCEEMFEAICKHLEYATNGGNIRPTITIFPQRKETNKDFRVWNGQGIQYAGYRQADGTIIGDPANVELTEVCISLGWKPKDGRFNVLPLILQSDGGKPKMFEIPTKLILQVNITHPRYQRFEELDLRWYAVPMVSNMCLDMGGVEFPGSPFNGWYMVTEIGVRDFGDVNRYNMLEPVAKLIGLDTKSNASLWKDVACVELNVAVLYSFQEAGVTITDHHTASDSFVKHMENEEKARGGCPADWVWIVPPMSGSLTAVFHQEMLNYIIKPSFEYQDDPWKHVQIGQDGAPLHKRKRTVKVVAIALTFLIDLTNKMLAKRTKAVVLYASESGKSKGYAEMLTKILLRVFNSKVVCMDVFPHSSLSNEQLVLIVTSTFGNGDPPTNGMSFDRFLYDASQQQNRLAVEEMIEHETDFNNNNNKLLDGVRPRDSFPEDSVLCFPIIEIGTFTLGIQNNNTVLLKGFSVFGLGSRAYPNFCAFARSVDENLQVLGGQQLVKLGEGDELYGEEDTFNAWSKMVFKAACVEFSVGDVTSAVEDNSAMSTIGWSPGNYRVTKDERQCKNVCANLSSTRGRTLCSAEAISVENLQSKDSSRSTMLVRLDVSGIHDFNYKPGDHLSIFPANREELVQALLDRLYESPDPDDPIKVEIYQTDSDTTILGRLPEPITLREAFSRHIDITGTPTPHVLHYLSTQTSDQEHKRKLELLGKGDVIYEEWKYKHQANIVEVLQEYSSVQIKAIFLLTQLPLLQPRLYSISSSQDLCPGQVHVTVAVVKFDKSGVKGSVHYGVCSTWLSELKPRDIVPCFVKQAPAFHLPEDRTVPVILVGPGSGIAPFRSFWQQRQYETSKSTMTSLKASSDNFNDQRKDEALHKMQLPEEASVCSTAEHNSLTLNTKRQDEGSLGSLGEMILYFGCRSSKQDDIYRHDTLKAVKDGALTEVKTAFSREPKQPKQYVQDLLARETRHVVDMLQSRGGHIYVCGDVSMAAEVSKTIQVLLENDLGLTPTAALAYINKLKHSGRYHEDIFGITLRTREVTDRARAVSAMKREIAYPPSSSNGPSKSSSEVPSRFCMVL